MAGRTELWVLDAGRPGPLRSGTLFRSPREGAELLSAAFRPSGALTAVEACCGQDPSRFRIVPFDPPTGEQGPPLS